jgi:hypothetical protein
MAWKVGANATRLGDQLVRARHAWILAVGRR